MAQLRPPETTFQVVCETCEIENEVEGSERATEFLVDHLEAGHSVMRIPVETSV